MEEFILFLMSFGVVYLVYQIFIIRKAKRRNSTKRPIEVTYLINKYHLDIKRINYKKLLQCISIVSSLDISLLVSIVFMFDNFIYQILLVILLVVPVILLSYHVVGIYYVRKGLIINE